MINRLPKDFSAASSTAGNSHSRISGLQQGDDQGYAARLLESAAECVGQRPLLSLGVMFALGIVLGKLVKR
jgi:hypothetical protein